MEAFYATASTTTILVHTSTQKEHIVYLPSISTSTYRILTIRDSDGYASPTNPILLSTLVGASFYSEFTKPTITTPFGYITFQTLATGVYTPITIFESYSSHPLANASNFFTETIQFHDQSTDATNPMFISYGQLYFSTTIRGQITTSNLTSTVQGLGTAGYISSLSTATERLFNSTLLGLETVLYTDTSIVTTTYTNTVSPFSIDYTNPTAPTLFVASGIDQIIGSLQYSSDGSNWNSNSSGGFQYGANGIGKIRSTWIATGQYDTNGTKLGSIQVSTNGSKWLLNTSGGFQVGFCVLGGTSPMLLVGGNVNTALGSIQYGFDGITWNSNVSGGFNDGCKCLGWNGSYWLAGGPIPAFGTGAIQKSVDGSNWTSNLTGLSAGVNGVAWNGSYWVAVGRGVAQPLYSIQVSRDGVNWSNIQSGGFINYGGAVAWNGTMWVAVGTYLDGSTNSNANIQYSYDGLNWSNSVSGAFYGTVGPFLGGGTGIVWDTQKSLWVATGLDTTSVSASIKYSKDGSNWFNSVTGGFTGGGINKGNAIYTPTLTYNPTIVLNSLQLNLSYQPVPLQPTTHAITVFQSTLALDTTVYINPTISSIGIRTNPSSNNVLTIQGTCSFYSTLSISTLASVQSISSIPLSSTGPGNPYKKLWFSLSGTTLGYNPA